MTTLFADFSNCHFLVLVTLHCRHFPNQRTDFDNFSLILISIQCYLLCSKCQNPRRYPCDSFWEVGSHIGTVTKYTQYSFNLIVESSLYLNGFKRSGQWKYEQPSGRHSDYSRYHFCLFHCLTSS